VVQTPKKKGPPGVEAVFRNSLKKGGGGGGGDSKKRKKKCGCGPGGGEKSW